MAVYAEVGTLVCPAAPGEQVVSLSSFGGNAPKALLLSSTGQTADGVTTEAQMAFGVAVSSTSRAAVAIASQDNVGTSVARRRHDNTKCLTVINAAGTVLAAADLLSFGADQYALAWSVVTSGLRVNWQAVGGDISVNLKEITSPASTGNVSYTGVGFEPECLVAFSTGHTAALGTTTFSPLVIGLSNGTSNYAIGLSGFHGQGTSDTSRILSSQHIWRYIYGTESRQSAYVASMDADGYTWTWDAADTGARYVWILAIRGAQFSVGSLLQPLATGQQTQALGFNGKSAMLLTAMGHPTIAPDSVGSNDGTLVGGPVLSYDVPSVLTGKSLRFDGVDDYVSIPGGGGLNNLQTGTISMWVKWTGTQDVGAYSLYGAVLGRQKDGAWSEAIALTTADPNTAKIRLFVYSKTSIFSSISPGSGTWRHIVVVLTPSAHSIYVDGVLDGQDTSPAAINDDTSVPLSLGAWLPGGNSYSQSNIADPRIYNRALTPTEVAQLAAGTDVTDGLVSRWSFDDLTGSGIENDARIGIGFLDHAGNQAFAGAVDEDGQDTTDADRIQDSDNCLLMLDHEQNVLARATGSFNGTDMVLDWDVADAVARESAWLVFGESSTAPLAVAEVSIDLHRPFTYGTLVGTLEATGGTPAYEWEIVSETLN